MKAISAKIQWSLPFSFRSKFELVNSFPSLAENCDSHQYRDYILILKICFTRRDRARVLVGCEWWRVRVCAKFDRRGETPIFTAFNRRGVGRVCLFKRRGTTHKHSVNVHGFTAIEFKLTHSINVHFHWFMRLFALQIIRAMSADMYVLYRLFQIQYDREKRLSRNLK